MTYSSHCILLQLTLGRLGKLHGKAQPHSEEVEWWRTLMVECVRIFDTLELVELKNLYTFHHESSPPFNFLRMCTGFSIGLFYNCRGALWNRMIQTWK